MTPEGLVKSKARKIAHDLGFYTFPVNQQGLGRRGVPDDFLLIRGEPYFVEFKAYMRWDSNGNGCLVTLPTVLQAREMDTIRKNGGTALVVDNASFSMYLEWLQQRAQYVNSEERPPVGLIWNTTIEDYMHYRHAPWAKAKTMLSWPSGLSIGLPVISKGENYEALS